MITSLMAIAVSKVRKGDQFRDSATGKNVWTALADAETLDSGRVQTSIQYNADGGCDTRIWEDAKHVLLIAREEVGHHIVVGLNEVEPWVILCEHLEDAHRLLKADPEAVRVTTLNALSTEAVDREIHLLEREQNDEPTDDQIYNRPGMEGGIPYKMGN